MVRTPSQQLAAAIFQNLVAGFCLAWVQEIGNEVDNPYSQPVSRLRSKIILHSLT